MRATIIEVAIANPCSARSKARACQPARIYFGARLQIGQGHHPGQSHDESMSSRPCRLNFRLKCAYFVSRCHAMPWRSVDRRRNKTLARRHPTMTSPRHERPFPRGHIRVSARSEPALRTKSSRVAIKVCYQGLRRMTRLTARDIVTAHGNRGQELGLENGFQGCRSKHKVPRV
jgi:hypothetical protein